MKNQLSLLDQAVPTTRSIRAATNFHYDFPLVQVLNGQKKQGFRKFAVYGADGGLPKSGDPK